MEICRLTVVQGHEDQTGQVFLVHEDERRTLGRSSTCDFFVQDQLVSALHAQVEWHDSGFVVKDLLARNGVLVDGVPIDSHRLETGDRFRIGKTVFEFALENDGNGSKKRVDTSLVTHDEAVPENLGVTQASPLMGTPLGQLINDKNDLVLCKLAIMNGQLSHKQIREGLNIQKEMAEVKIRMSLGEIFEERDYLSADQVKGLLREQEYRKIRNKDVLFGQVAITNSLSTREQVEAALQLQEKMFQAGGGGEVPRIGEILVTKGHLSINDSNRIMKSLRDVKEAF